MKATLALLCALPAALLAGCETSAVWYATHPEKQVVEIDGTTVSVVPRGPGHFDALGGAGERQNWAEIKGRQVRAVERVSGCRVTAAEYIPGSTVLQTTVACR